MSGQNVLGFLHFSTGRFIYTVIKQIPIDHYSRFHCFLSKYWFSFSRTPAEEHVSLPVPIKGSSLTQIVNTNQIGVVEVEVFQTIAEALRGIGNSSFLECYPLLQQ